MMSSVKENQPRTMALVPTPDLTLPLPKSSAMVLAATEAVCCHRTDTSTKMEAMKMMASATCDTGRLGKGFTSRSEPSLSSSSCQPGKVASRRKQMKAKIMAMMLQDTVSTGWQARRQGLREQRSEYSHEVGEHDRVLELARQPDEVQGVLVDRDLLGERGGVVGAQPAAAVRVDADAEVAHAGLQVGVAGQALDGRVGGVVDLGCVGPRGVVVIVEGYQEDVGDERAR